MASGYYYFFKFLNAGNLTNNSLIVNIESTKIEEIRNETAHVALFESCQLENLLMPIPYGIATLSDLKIMAACLGDFSMAANGPEGGFKHVKYPNSFQASLVQVSNAGHKAFLKAHVNMDKIRLYTLNVPGYMEDIFEILESQEDDVIKCMLPNQLESVRNVANQCQLLSKEVVDEFKNVLNLTNEVKEVCTATKGDKEMKNTDALKREEELKNQKMMTEKMVADLEQDKKKMEQTMNDAYATTFKAMDEMPGMAKTIAADSVEKFVNFLTFNWKSKSSSSKQVHESAQFKVKAAQVKYRYWSNHK